MQDLQTKSLWSQISGECISGPMEGARLELFNSRITTYSEFKKLYPNGLLLKKKNKGRAGSSYGSYFESKEKLGIFGRSNTFEKLDGKDIVYGLNLSSGKYAVSENYLSLHGFALLPETDPKILVTYDKKGQTVTAFALDEFSQDEVVSIKIENKTISLTDNSATWHSGSGKSIEGGKKDLNPLPLISSFWFAWITFFPETELIK